MDNYTTEIKQSNRGFRNGKNKGMLNIGYFLLMDRQQERVVTLWLLPFIWFGETYLLVVVTSVSFSLGMVIY